MTMLSACSRARDCPCFRVQGKPRPIHLPRFVTTDNLVRYAFF